MDVDAGKCPSPPAAGSAKRSLRTALDGTPDRPQPGRPRGREEPERCDLSEPSDVVFCAGANLDR
eukprot:14412-Pleurochrysis_carterae.AAC.1